MMKNKDSRQTMKNKIITSAAFLSLQLCSQAISAVKITAACNNSKNVILNISDTQVSIKGPPSGFNLESTLQLNGVSKPGYTAIFYGGQSKYFNSYDGTTSFNSTIGHGGSNKISKAELMTKSGQFSCIIK